MRRNRMLAYFLLVHLALGISQPHDNAARGRAEGSNTGGALEVYYYHIYCLLELNIYY